MTAMINAMMAMVLVFTTSPSRRWARPRDALRIGAYPFHPKTRPGPSGLTASEGCRAR